MALMYLRLLWKEIAIIMVTAALSAEEPRMRPREVPSETVLVRDGEPTGLIVAPRSGPWLDAARKIQDTILRQTGARLPLLSPRDATGKDVPMLTDACRKRAVLFVGNISTNPALFEPYVRTWFTVDEKEPGSWTVQTFPNPWGTGVGYALAGASSDSDAPKAADEFIRLCEKHCRDKTLALPRVCLPGPDRLVQAAAGWRRVARPARQDLIPMLKKSRAMHLGYGIGDLIHRFTMITDLGLFNSEEVNDIEQEVLTNILMIPEKVWWYRGGLQRVDGRHELYKNPRLYLAIEHLLRVGRPNDAARDRLERMAAEIRVYLHYAATTAYRSDHEGSEADHGWQNAIWFALVAGDWDYFTSGRGRESALYGLLETDNSGALAGHIQYGDVENLQAPSTVVNAIRVAAWWHRDGRLKWLLENMRLSDACPYGFPMRLPLADIESVEPNDWLGVQWLPVSPHSYGSSIQDRRWLPLDVPREKTFDLLTFRSGFGEKDQYLAIDGFQNHFQPLGVCSVLRYSDLGKLFLVAHTGREGNYYKSGSMASEGATRAHWPTRVGEDDGKHTAVGEIESGGLEQGEPWGAELVLGANLPTVGLAEVRTPTYHGTNWTRTILWKRGEYFVFLDEFQVLAPGEFVLTDTWRTCAPASLEGRNWVQKQGDVSFFLKSAFPVMSDAGLAPAEEYQNEIVPFLLRQSVLLSAKQAGDGACFQNLLYASSPERQRDYDILRLAPNCVIVKGADELALLGRGSCPSLGIETDARTFYLSPSTVAIGAGTKLSLSGARLLHLRKPGNSEQELRGDKSAAVRNALEHLWDLAARNDASPSILAFPEGKSKVVWSYDGFRRTPRALRPLESRSAADEWSLNLGQESDIGGVTALLDAAVPNLEAAFSNDQFRADVRTATPTGTTDHVIGPFGKSFYITRSLTKFNGQPARYVRVRAPKGRTILDVTILSKESDPAFIVAKRDGMILALDRDGRVARRRLLRPGLRSVVAGDRIIVAGPSEIYCLDAEFTAVDVLKVPARVLAPAGHDRFAAATEDGRILLLSQ